MKFSEFNIQARYPQAEEATTGGPCTAWYIELPEGNEAHILITEPDDAYMPKPDDRVVGVGVYTNGERSEWRFQGPVAVSDLGSFLDATIADSAKRGAK
jgi:hypothetical protein